MVKDSFTQSSETSKPQKVNGHVFFDKFSSSVSSSFHSKTFGNIRSKPFSSLNNATTSHTSKQSTLLPVKLSKFSKKENALQSPDFSLSKSVFASNMVNNMQNNLSPNSSPAKSDNNLTCNNISNQNTIHENNRKVEINLQFSKLKAQPSVYRKMFGVFKENQDVLARWSDGLYYFGTVKQVRDFEHRCFVQFEDKSTCWVYFKDLQPIIKENSLNDCCDSDVTCAVCRDGKSEKPNEIVLCDKCGQGFHQFCHVPHIDSTVVNDEDETWQCRMCVFAAVARKGGADCSGPGVETLKQMKRELPYDINSLSWDKGHKSNNEETYCYCGGPGDWYLKMLQCSRCMQWFHEACLHCLDHPVLYGDRFFLFVCSVCNDGEEFIKRLPIKWVDVVHLVLYNITITKTNKYYDFSSTILPFFAQNWDSLRLEELALEPLSRSHLKERVLEALQNNKSRFQSGVETKKAKLSWGLKTRSPPTPPTVNLPSSGIINESLVQTMDLRHGLVSIIESPTPLKRNAPGDFRLPSDSPPHKLSKDSSSTNYSSPIKLNGSSVDPSNTDGDNLFEKFYSLNNNEHRQAVNIERRDVQEKKKRGRPRKISCNKPVTSPIASARLPSIGGGKWKKKDNTRMKKEQSGFASDNSTIPISELFRDIPGSTSSETTLGSDAFDNNLRRTMARYYGAEGRIACGERFNILAKRVVSNASGGGDDPRVEYLIEWEGYTASQLHASVQKR